MINNLDNVWDSPTRTIEARVDLYDGSTLVNTFNGSDHLVSLFADRVGANGKFFGFGITQSIKFELTDKERALEIKEDNIAMISFKSGGYGYISPFPDYYITSVTRDENTNGLKIEAEDVIMNKASKHTVSELNNWQNLNTMADYLIAISEFLYDGEFKVMPIGMTNSEIEEIFQKIYDQENIINLDGTETIREVLDDIAEASQTIYFVGKQDDMTENLFIKKLDNGEAVLTVDKSNYFTLSDEDPRILTGICNATELGDNISATSGDPGEMQYIRDNAFWELRSDIADIVDYTLAANNGLSITPFNLEWRGNAALEIGDKINIISKDNNVITTYVLNDSIEYTGGMKQKTSWSYEVKNESESNPTSLGEALKRTFARVDKANQEVEIVAGEVSSLKITTDNITTSVTKIDENMSDLASTVNTKVTAEDVTFSIEKALGDGVDKVTTATGFTFNEQGLNISKSSSELNTQITENGLTINKRDEEVLSVSNLGVKAEDLHATTFLIIGNNSRIEDYGSTRTGCFWIGG